MPGDVINLRQARKAKAKRDKDSDAAANRAKFGRTKEDKAVEDARHALRDRTLDGARREPPPGDPDR